jgi:hypothetical protein
MPVPVAVRVSDLASAGERDKLSKIIGVTKADHGETCMRNYASRAESI